MILTEDNFYWEDRNSGLYLCLTVGQDYRDLKVMSVEPQCLNTYLWWIINGMLSSTRIRCIYYSPTLINKVVLRDIKWLVQNFRG